MATLGHAAVDNAPRAIGDQIVGIVAFGCCADGSAVCRSGCGRLTIATNCSPSDGTDKQTGNHLVLRFLLRALRVVSLGRLGDPTAGCKIGLELF